MISSFNIQMLKMSLLDSSLKDSVFVIILAFFGVFFKLQFQHTSQSTTEAPGFYAAWWWKFSASPARTPKEISWYVIIFEQYQGMVHLDVAFLTFLLKSSDLKGLFSAQILR